MAPHAAWLYGYGSLIWQPPSGLAGREPVFVRGWSRRFWQGSPDHRGTPAAPGRVVTLVPDEGAICWGVAYSLGAVDADALLASLDVREAGGYTRTDLEVHADDPSQVPRRAITYIGTDTNSSYLGPASTREICDDALELVRIH